MRSSLDFATVFGVPNSELLKNASKYAKCEQIFLKVTKTQTKIRMNNKMATIGSKLGISSQIKTLLISHMLMGCDLSNQTSFETVEMKHCQMSRQNWRRFQSPFFWNKLKNK